MHIDVAKVKGLYWNDREYSYESIIICRNVLWNDRNYSYDLIIFCRNVSWNDRKYSYDSIIVCRNVSSYAVAQAAPLLEQDNRRPGNYGSSDMCGRCGKAVFFAEKVMGGGGVSILLEQLCVCNQIQCMRTFLGQTYV